MATRQTKPETNRDAKKYICPTPHLPGHTCSNNQGKALKKLMEKKKLSVDQLSESSSVLTSTLEKVISGHSTLTFKGLMKVAKGLKMSPLALAGASLNESRFFKKPKKMRA